ncbi:hypothetical protein [Halosimplex marinum]|uniref:hypothetical protein n=1 Tax=Halosimplex marinum TaxID=3396620 RepID=UPI003F55EB54
MVPEIRPLVRGLTVAATAALLAVLGYYLVQPGGTWSRLALFAAIGGAAVAGAAGAVSRRPLVAAGGACGLFLLGFWQAALWMFVFPAAGLLIVAALLGATDDGPTAPVAG